MEQSKKQLSFDNLYREHLQPYFENITDHRGNNIIYSLSDVLSSCFAMFSLKSTSLLDFEQRTKQESSNILEVYGLDKIPGDSQVRNVLDKVNTTVFHGLFPELFKVLKKTGALTGYKTLKGRMIVSIDGTSFFESKKVTCPYCLQKKQRDGSISCSHAMLSGVLVHPDKKEVFPLANEVIVQQDGDTKNDCEINAAKRLLQRLQEQYKTEKLLVVEDALYANGPHIRQLLGAGMDYIINVKPDGNDTLFKQFEGRWQRKGVKEKHIKQTDGSCQSFYFTNNLRLNGSHNIGCNMLIYETTDKQGKTKRFSWITNIPLHARNVVQIMKSARARWKIENETFNTLKNQGYNLEHNYGHGKQYLANNFAILMMLAFLTDQIQQACCKLFITAWKGIGTKIKLWEVIRSIFRLKPIKSMKDCLFIILAEFELKIE